jgi:hypothetical protein
VQPLQHRNQPGRNRCPIPGHEPLRRQPAADARRISGLPGTCCPQRRCRPRTDNDALGDATAAEVRRAADYQHQEYIVAALAKPENRCLVPFNSFAEYAPEPNPETKKKDVVWFALNDDRPLTAFAGIWAEFRGDRGMKSKPIPGPHLVYGFLTTSPNSTVGMREALAALAAPRRHGVSSR